MNKLLIPNIAVITTALGATLIAVYTNTNWFSLEQNIVKRERCYGIARIGKNDCGTSKHSCAAQATTNGEPEEFIMIPKGLCQRIVGAKLD